MQTPSPVAEPRSHSFGRGWAWTRGGFDLFNRARGVSVAMVLCWLVVGLLLEQIPAGGLLSNLLYLVWMAGWMMAARRAEQEGRVEFADLFAGFRSAFTPLMLGGLALTVAVVLIMQVSLMLLGSWGMGDLLGQPPTSLTPDEARAVLMAMLVGLLLAVPLLMAVTFAPALILFERVSVPQAMRLSFRACLRNMAPFLLWSILACLLLLLGGMLMLIGLLVVMPALNYSIYVAYRDIFGAPVMDAPSAPSEPPSPPGPQGHFDA